MKAKKPSKKPSKKPKASDKLDEDFGVDEDFEIFGDKGGVLKARDELRMAEMRKDSASIIMQTLPSVKTIGGKS